MEVSHLQLLTNGYRCELMIKRLWDLSPPLKWIFEIMCYLISWIRSNLQTQNRKKSNVNSLLCNIHFLYKDSVKKLNLLSSFSK